MGWIKQEEKEALGKKLNKTDFPFKSELVTLLLIKQLVLLSFHSNLYINILL